MEINVQKSDRNGDGHCAQNIYPGNRRLCEPEIWQSFWDMRKITWNIWILEIACSLSNGLLTLIEPRPRLRQRPRPRNWVQHPMALATVLTSVWCVLFHTLLCNPIFIGLGLGLGHCQCEQAISPEKFECNFKCCRVVSRTGRQRSVVNITMDPSPWNSYTKIERWTTLSPETSHSSTPKQWVAS